MFRILIVDDFAPFRALARWHCQHLGLVVGEADSGEHGLAELAARHHDVALVDVHMEPMDGFAFVRALRAREEHRALKVIMVTADASLADGQAKQTGIDGFLLKPLDRAALKLLLTAWNLFRDDGHFPGFVRRDDAKGE